MPVELVHGAYLCVCTMARRYCPHSKGGNLWTGSGISAKRLLPGRALPFTTKQPLDGLGHRRIAKGHLHHVKMDCRV